MQVRARIEEILQKYQFVNVLQDYTFDQREGLRNELESLINQVLEEKVRAVEEQRNLQEFESDEYQRIKSAYNQAIDDVLAILKGEKERE